MKDINRITGTTTYSINTIIESLHDIYYKVENPKDAKIILETIKILLKLKN